MRCGPCGRSRHLRCEGTWCECCGIKKLDAPPSRTPKQAGSSSKGGRSRSARSAPAPRPKPVVEKTEPKKVVKPKPPKKPRPRKNVGACSVPGCEKPAKANGMCGMHDMRRWRHGDPLTKLPHNKGRPIEVTPEQGEQIEYFYGRGLSQTSVAKVVDGVSRDQVRGWLLRKGLLRSQA